MGSPEMRSALERLGQDVRKDGLGLALTIEQGQRRGRSFATRLRAQKAQSKEAQERQDVVDPDGASF